MPNYTIEKIIDATHFRKDGTEIISRTGKKMWRVTIHVAELPGKYIVGFTPWEPDERFLGVWDLTITTKQWEDRINYCFSLTALMRSQNTQAAAEMVTSLPNMEKMVPTVNDELVCKMSEAIDRLSETVGEMRGILGIATGIYP